MNTTELRGMEKSELEEKIKRQLKQELFHFRCQLAMGRIENPMRIRATNQARSGQSQNDFATKGIKRRVRFSLRISD